MKAVRLAIVWIAALWVVAACGSGSTKIPDAKEDLKVIKEKWTSDDPKNSFKTQQMNVVSFTLKNNSTTQAYRRINVTVDYLSKEGTHLDSDKLMVPKTIKPGETLEVDNMYGGFVNPLTSKAVITVADAAKTE